MTVRLFREPDPPFLTTKGATLAGTAVSDAWSSSVASCFDSLAPIDQVTRWTG